jgi:hypothetical protein
MNFRIRLTNTYLLKTKAMKVNNQFFIGLAIMIMASCNPPAGNASGDKTAGPDSVQGAQNTTPSPAESATDTILKSKAVKPDINQLVGDWLRTDGGKTIRIKSATADGKLVAEYYNPKPIHVDKAEWMIKDNNLIISVVLKDVNYPGSAYTLQYFPSDDQLAGNYFQAVEGANYEVDFVRQK